jgi:hypothetical protein
MWMSHGEHHKTETETLEDGGVCTKAKGQALTRKDNVTKVSWNQSANGKHVHIPLNSIPCSSDQKG